MDINPIQIALLKENIQTGKEWAACNGSDNQIMTLVNRQISRIKKLYQQYPAFSAWMNDAPKKDIEALAIQYSNYGFFRND